MKGRAVVRMQILSCQEKSITNENLILEISGGVFVGGWSVDCPVFIAKRLLSAAKVAVHVRKTTAIGV